MGLRVLNQNKEKAIEDVLDQWYSNDHSIIQNKLTFYNYKRVHCRQLLKYYMST